MGRTGLHMCERAAERAAQEPARRCVPHTLAAAGLAVCCVVRSCGRASHLQSLPVLENNSLIRLYRRRRLFHSAEGRTTTVRRGPQRCAMVAAAVDAAGAFLGNDRTSLMLMDHDLRELHRSASLRADGSSTRGRKTKHDTATRRWIDTVGFPMLAQGRLPDAHDIAMLRSGPRHLLSGTALAARDAWSSQLHQGDNAR